MFGHVINEEQEELKRGLLKVNEITLNYLGGPNRIPQVPIVSEGGRRLGQRNGK